MFWDFKMHPSTYCWLLFKPFLNYELIWDLLYKQDPPKIFNENMQ